MSDVRLHVWVSGRVQGVFFRANAKKIAQKLGLVGWVKNLPDGRVESIVEGTENKVDEFINFMRTGPSSARVESIEVKREEPEDSFDSFEILF